MINATKQFVGSPQPGNHGFQNGGVDSASRETLQVGAKQLDVVQQRRGARRQSEPSPPIAGIGAALDHAKRFEIIDQTSQRRPRHSGESRKLVERQMRLAAPAAR